jgi:hypothetical protein
VQYVHGGKLMHTQLHAIEAPLPYLESMAERPYTYTYTPPPGVARTNRRVTPRIYSHLRQTSGPQAAVFSQSRPM